MSEPKVTMSNDAASSHPNSIQAPGGPVVNESEEEKQDFESEESEEESEEEWEEESKENYYQCECGKRAACSHCSVIFCWGSYGHGTIECHECESGLCDICIRNGKHHTCNCNDDD
jgi:hypothetical protein